VRSELSQVCLTLRAMRIAYVSNMDWRYAPPAAEVQRAESLPDRLSATGGMG